MRLNPSFHSRLVFAAIALTSALAGCAGAMPKADPSEAWIGLQDTVTDAMLAHKVDGQAVKDSRYFEVKPGAHQLSVTLFHVYTANEDDNCSGSVHYANFNPGEHYTLVESRRGPSVDVRLNDAQGKTLASATDISCTPA